MIGTEIIIAHQDDKLCIYHGLGYNYNYIKLYIP